MGRTVRSKLLPRPKLLFVALAQSTHTHAWIDLLRNQKIDVRLFGVAGTAAPKSFGFSTYVFQDSFPSTNPHRKVPFSRKDLLVRGMAKLSGIDASWFEERWLAKIIREWRPQIIHTLGLDPAAFLYFRARERYKLQKIGKWVLTARGGPELALKRLVADDAKKIRAVLSECDQFIADNEQNYGFAIELGLNPSRICPLGVVPGTGGVNVDELWSLRKVPPSKSRLILFPKAYECPASKALPVLEALGSCWERLMPCEIHMTAAIPETKMWFGTLPKGLRQVCHIQERIDRGQLLGLMARARVMLAPSLTDGIPNSLYESMATGAFPIVSPIETLRYLVAHEKNVLFARNLYPDEIAATLIRAMADDKLVDSATSRNIEWVRSAANRTEIAPKVFENYRALAEAGN